MKEDNIDKTKMYYIHLLDRFMADPCIEHFRKIRQRILERTVPSYILNTETNKLTTEYDPDVQKALDKINKEEAEYIEVNYPDIKKAQD